MRVRTLVASIAILATAWTTGLLHDAFAGTAATKNKVTCGDPTKDGSVSVIVRTTDKTVTINVDITASMTAAEKAAAIVVAFTSDTDNQRSGGGQYCSASATGAVVTVTASGTGNTFKEVDISAGGTKEKDTISGLPNEDTEYGVAQFFGDVSAPGTVTVGGGGVEITRTTSDFASLAALRSDLADALTSAGRPTTVLPGGALRIGVPEDFDGITLQVTNESMWAESLRWEE